MAVVDSGKYPAIEMKSFDFPDSLFNFLEYINQRNKRVLQPQTSVTSLMMKY